MCMHSIYLSLEGVPIPGPPNGPLTELLWSLIVAIWGTIEGSWGV